MILINFFRTLLYLGSLGGLELLDKILEKELPNDSVQSVRHFSSSLYCNLG